jgi:hypothetical protein
MLGVLLARPWFFATSAESASSSYLAQAREGRQIGWLPYLTSSFDSHLRELGEIFLNFPSTRFPFFTPLLWIASAMALSVVVAGLPRLARRLPALAVYAGFYLTLILFWPFYDPRFWMPLLPIMFLCGWLASENVVFHAAVRRAVDDLGGGFCCARTWRRIVQCSDSACRLAIPAGLRRRRHPRYLPCRLWRDPCRRFFGCRPAGIATSSAF